MKLVDMSLLAKGSVKVFDGNVKVDLKQPRI